MTLHMCDRCGFKDSTYSKFELLTVSSLYYSQYSQKEIPRKIELCINCMKKLNELLIPVFKV